MKNGTPVKKVIMEDYCDKMNQIKKNTNDAPQEEEYEYDEEEYDEEVEKNWLVNCLSNIHENILSFQVSVYESHIMEIA